MAYNTRIFTPVSHKRRGAYFTCETCIREFYVYPSEIKKHEKNGSRIRFCNMKCYDKTGKNNPMYGRKHTAESKKKFTSHPNRPRFTAENNPNFVRFGEEYGFSGITREWWVRKLLKEIGKCERCGFNDKRALSVHHKDRNNKNNVKENLMLLCWNCHTIDHYDSRDGMYSNLINDIYERDKKINEAA